MAGIYIHIPFCKQACHYCDFHFSTSVNGHNAMVEAITMEMELRQSFPGQEKIETLYFGGGTPSLLNSSQLQKLYEAARRHFSFGDKVEFTLEANPDDLSEAKAFELADAGVNRLSIGIQSFSDQYLKWMNRAHDSSEAIRSVQLAQKAGITNISIDLIYGLPELSAALWKAEVQKAIDLGVKHVSAYCLTVEPGTALGSRVKKGKEAPVDDEAAAVQFDILIDTLADAGIEQYEVSNFAFPDYYSRHNTAYWQGVPYVGLGPSAHGFNGAERCWNVANNAQYIKAINAGTIPQTVEKLSDADRVNELLMTGLRTKWGVDLNDISRRFDIDIAAENCALIKSWTDIDLAVLSDGVLILTQKGMLLADGWLRSYLYKLFSLHPN